MEKCKQKKRRIWAQFAKYSVHKKNICRETEEQVSILQKSLHMKSQELEQKNKLAESKLKQMVRPSFPVFLCFARVTW